MTITLVIALRIIFVGYNYNYMINYPAKYLGDNFVDQGTLHVFNVGSKWVFSFMKTVREKIAFEHFPWNFLHFRQREKVAETFRQCTFSFDNQSFFILARVIAQEVPKTLKWPSGCAHLLVHIRRCPRLARLGFKRGWLCLAGQPDVYAGRMCHILSEQLESPPFL